MESTKMAFRKIADLKMDLKYIIRIDEIKD